MTKFIGRSLYLSMPWYHHLKTWTTLGWASENWGLHELVQRKPWAQCLRQNNRLYTLLFTRLHSFLITHNLFCVSAPLQEPCSCLKHRRPSSSLAVSFSSSRLWLKCLLLEWPFFLLLRLLPITSRCLFFLTILLNTLPLFCLVICFSFPNGMEA